MKKKEFNKKLSLNKQTVSELNKNDMLNIKGGSLPLCMDTVGPSNGCPPPGTGDCHDGYSVTCRMCEPV